jgi:hypothetical protein
MAPVTTPPLEFATGWESHPLTASAPGVCCDDPSGETTLAAITVAGYAQVGCSPKYRSRWLP